MTSQPFALFELEEYAPPARAAAAVRAPLPHERRIVADSGDRVAWLRARSRGVTATDAAKLSSRQAVRSAAWDKLHGTGGRSFGGSRFTDHGREREPVIADWVRREHGIDPSGLLFHADGETRHLATPDGLAVRGGAVELCEIKTTTKAWRGIPRGYLRQVWWQQYVLGAERTLVVWEQHDGFVPVGEPECRWVDRDDDQIQILVGLAEELLALIAPTAAPLAPPAGRDRGFYRPGPLA
ncbi:YqaJ viral recombinase family protein [Agromyces sp. LHK192]|uniref:YqaJ viral recombinase family protein n=1 Tax=Agromyces sp. LHK192 TaxID=2498704 RepID=UPI000FD730D1